MTTGKNAGKAGNKNNKAANTSAPASAPATPAAETTNSNKTAEGEEPAAGAPATQAASAPATPAAETTNSNTPAEGEKPAANAPATAPATPAAPKQKARIPLKGVSRRGGGGGGGKSLGTVYNIAEVMYGHITTKTVKGEKETAVMHHIINGEATFEKDATSGEVFINFGTAGPKLYSFVANVNNKTDRKTSIYKEVEGDVPVLDAKGEPVLNDDKTPKTVKGMVPAPGCAWHGFIVATPENAAKVYANIKAMLTNPLTEGSVLRNQITLLEPPFNLHSGAAATLSLETETA